MAIDFQKLLKNLSDKISPTDNQPKITPIYSIKTTSDNDKALKEELDKIDRQFTLSPTHDIKLPELELERMEYRPLSDQEIEELAKSSLAEYYNKSSKAIEQDAINQQKNLEDYKKQLYDALVQKEQNITQSYDQAKKDVAAQALKRGLARSSIAVLMEKELDAQKAKEIAQARNSYIEQAAEIDYKIADLEAKKQAAMNDLDITYAAKLAIEINELKQEREQKIKEVQKYNNELAKLQAQYNIDKLKAEQDLTLGQYKILKNKTAGLAEIEQEIEKQKQQKKFEYLLDYLSGIPKKEAIKFAETNPVVKESLDTYYYRKLLNALEARSD
ncbi:MAG TPA: hypothetical protein VIL23_05560 [Clostridia bacterium]